MWAIYLAVPVLCRVKKVTFWCLQNSYSTDSINNNKKPDSKNWKFNKNLYFFISDFTGDEIVAEQEFEIDFKYEIKLETSF
jgi:hypothetical protein